MFLSATRTTPVHRLDPSDKKASETTLGRFAARTADRDVLTAEAEVFRPACAALPVAFFLRGLADAEVEVVAAADEPRLAVACAAGAARSVEDSAEVEQAGSVAAAVPAPDSVLDDCWAAPQADDHSLLAVPAPGCSAVADLPADDSVPADYLAPADSVLDDCSAAT